MSSFLDLNFEIIKRADNSRYRNGNDIGLVNLAPIALLSIFKLTTSSGKQLEVISHAYLVSLIYKKITSSKDSNDLSIGFDRSRNRRKYELAQTKNVKGKYHLRIMLKDVFGFAEHHEKAIYGLGFKLVLEVIAELTGGLKTLCNKKGYSSRVPRRVLRPCIKTGCVSPLY